MRFIILCGSLALAACDPGETPRVSSSPLDDARAAIVARNFGQAVQFASDAVDEHPQDPAAHYQLARAEALQGNEGRALSALGLAIDRGLSDASRALLDPAFDSIRDRQAFVDLEERASPRRAPRRNAARDVEPEQDREPAVEIRSEGGREVVRAGDVVIDTEL